MPRPARKPAANSKALVKGQMALPHAGQLDKGPANEANNAFAAFSEWSGEADEKAYADL